MDYNLTENQKKGLQWLVGKVKERKISEEFKLVWTHGGPDILNYDGHEPVPHILSSGALRALDYAGLLQVEERNGLFSCTLTGNAYKAVDANFMNDAQIGQQVNIGAIIQSMSGGNIQAIGQADEATITQIVNDPNLLKAEIENITEKLLHEVQSIFEGKDLDMYREALEGVKEQILSDQPDPSIMKKLFKTLGFLGDLEGTINLIARVWPMIYPLIILAANKLG